MNLYNLFQEVILEGKANRQIISEGVSTNDVKAAIDGKYNVNIMYRDYENQPPSKRYIQVYNFSKTKGGNDCIRAYQIFGGSKTTPKSGAWKIFRLDKIEGWFPTNMKWVNPVSDGNSGIPPYNQTGDKTMASVNKMVDPKTFSRQRSDIGQGPTNNEINKTNTNASTNTSKPITT